MIICGTDFSPSAAAAATAAAQLAARAKTELRLVHVLAGLGDVYQPGAEHEVLLEPLKDQLAREAERLQAFGAHVVTELRPGAPDDVLTALAEQTKATLIVVGSLGKRGATRWLVGSTSERTALTAKCPVLVVREGDHLGPWLRGERPLKLMLGADFSAATEAAVRFLDKLCAFGACDVLATQVVWPPELHGRYGLRMPLEMDGLAEEAQAHVRRDLEQRLRPLAGKAQVTYEVRPGFGRPADHLLELAQRSGVDLIVVGTHQRGRLDRLRHGSVSQGVLHGAGIPVLCVPPHVERAFEPLPQVARVLASTDFSEHGDRATRMAYASIPAGGVVRLVHVVERAVTNPVYAQYGIGSAPKGDEELARSRLGEHLRTLVPPEAEERGIRTEVEVVESKDPAAAIAQAAERFGADVICMGSHGRTGLGKALLGSVTQGVIARSRRPVLVVKPPEA